MKSLFTSRIFTSLFTSRMNANVQLQICKRNLSKQKPIFGGNVAKKWRYTEPILDRAALLLLTRHGNHNQAEARNRVVASGRRLLSKSGQQLMTGTAFKYVIAPTNARVLPARLLLSLSLFLEFCSSKFRRFASVTCPSRFHMQCGSSCTRRYKFN